MDFEIAHRLSGEQGDETFQKKIVKLVNDYVKIGRDAVDYWSAEFDIAYDILMCYAPLMREDLEKLEKGHPKRFILPMSATQVTTMTTYIAQVLFGQDTPHKVEPRGPEDEQPAEFVNQLLRWNAEQQSTYLLGYLWAQDCIVANRGIFYNSWAPIYKVQTAVTEVPDPLGSIDPATGQPSTFQRSRRVSVPCGGYCRAELVSPYDFLCDTTLPLWRLHEMRFAGHKTLIPWVELHRRSSLSVDDPAYVLPSAVEALKGKGGRSKSLASESSGSSQAQSRVSRTAYERSRVGGTVGTEQADKSDHGVIECHELWVKIVPKDYDIYGPTDESQAPVVFQILVGGLSTVLALNESTYDHGQYPYSVAEARPSGQTQNSPSWIMLLKGVQDYVDWLKNRHQEALSRTVGNVFIADPSKVDFDDFMNPEKEGLLISLKPEAAGSKIGDVIQQVPIKDMTENFHIEMMDFTRMAESITGANSAMQGAIDQTPSATQFASAQQMSAGRMTSIARLLSSQALVGQARQVVSNFQQFLTDGQVVRFISEKMDLPEQLQGVTSVVLSRDSIQGSFDFIAHDGTLPGTDGRRVAALGKMVESMATFPDLFTPGPNNLDPRKIFFAMAKASGVNVENFKYTPEQPMDGASQGLPGGAGPTGAPPGPTGAPPGPSPSTPALPQIPDVPAPQGGLPPQIRPSQL